MTRIAEYGTYQPHEASKVEVLETGTMRLGFSTIEVTARLERASAGWEPAGSCARWTDDYFAVRYTHNGATHGRRFKDEAPALALFKEWTRTKVRA